MQINIDGKDYDTEDFTEDQKNIIRVLTTGSESVRLLEHILTCVKAANQDLTTNLIDSLGKPITEPQPEPEEGS